MTQEVELLRIWIIEALQYYRGAATMIDVSKRIWEEHEQDLRSNGDMFFRWQYSMRWAATTLRHEGILEPANHSDRGIWVLTQSSSI